MNKLNFTTFSREQIINMKISKNKSHSPKSLKYALFLQLTHTAFNVRCTAYLSLGEFARD